MPKVSVIIPCYNQEDYLEDAINSLVGEYKDFEIIVVNDGSTNQGADEKICSVITKFPDLRIRYINQSNQGVCVARNNAIAVAEGEFILPLDADDMVKNAYLKEAVEILELNPKIGIVYSNAEFVGNKQGIWNLAPATFVNMLSQNRIFNSAIYRKKSWEDVGGYKLEMFEGCEDWEFWITLMEYGVKVYKLDKVFYYHRILSSSRTSSALEFKNYFNIREKIVKFHLRLYLKYNLLVLIPLGLRILKKGLLCRK